MKSLFFPFLKIALPSLLLLLSQQSSLFSQINSNHDFQTWIFESMNKKVSKKDTFYLESEVRFGDDSGQLYLTYIQALLKHEFTPYLSVAPGYRQLWARTAAFSDFRPTFNPFIDIILKQETPLLILYDRSRIQYIIFEHLKNALLYRNRLYVTTVKDFGKMKAKPFVSDEIFFLERLGYQENRLNIGLSWPIEEMSANISYMLRYRKDLAREWSHQNILYLSLFIKI